MTKRTLKMATQAPSFRPTVVETHYGVTPALIDGVCAAIKHAETRMRHAGAEPRREGHAAAW